MSSKFHKLESEDDSQRLETLLRFQESLNLHFSAWELLDRALTHRSYINEAKRSEKAVHNERLEFLGDAVLGQAVATILYNRMPEGTEGDMARIKSQIVSEPVLASTALSIGLQDVLRMGRGEELSGGRSKKALLADALEALIGAWYVDQGAEKALDLVQQLLGLQIEHSMVAPNMDYKSILQEYAQKHIKTLPIYSIGRAEGPQHEKLFWVFCKLDGKSYGPFPGKTKKQAEQKAAEAVLLALEASSPEIANRLRSITGPALS